MFCTKCGNEVKEGTMFCPNCGNMVAPLPEAPASDNAAGEQNDNVIQDISLEEMEPVDLTKGMDKAPEPAASQQPYQPYQADQQQAQQPYQPYQADQQQAQQPYQTGQQPYQPYQTGQQPYQPYQTGQQPYQPYQQPVGKHVKPKKSKAPLIIAIVAVVVVLLGAVGFMLRPSIEMLISPEKQAKTALKQSSGNIAATVDEALSPENMSGSSPSMGKMDFTYSLNIDKATVADSDFLSYVKADTINMDLQMDPDNKIIAGTIGLAPDRSTSSVIEMEIYMDSNKTYFKVPAICSKSFYMSTETIFEDSDIDFDTFFSYMGGSSGSTDLSMFSSAARALMSDVFAAVDILIDDISYTKLGRVKLEGDQGSVKATQFAVAITEQNVKDFINNVVENVYNDDSLKALLGLVGTSINKDSIKSSINSMELGFGQLSFNICITNDKELVGISFDTDSITNYKGERVSAEMKFVGADNIYDCIAVNLTIDTASVSMSLSQSNDNVKINVDITPLQDEYAGEYLKAVMDASVSASDNVNGSLHINQFTITGNIDGQNIDVAASGDIGYKQIKALASNAADFSNAINVERMTSSQQNDVASEVIKNISVLKNVLSDDMYNQLYSSMFGSTSSTAR